MKNIPGFLLLLLLQFPHAGCADAPATAVSTPPNYNLAKPDVYTMPSVLKEISGLAFNHGNADTIYGEQDEEGKLFFFHWGDTEVKHTKFSKRGDFEDVAICNSQVIMLRSDGVFFTFPLAEKGNKDIDDVKEQDGLLPAGEYESLYADDAANTITMLCKNSSDDKASGNISGYIFTLAADGKLTKKSQFSIAEKTLAPANGDEKFKLKVSALSKNPVTHQWYILSSVNKLLVVADEQWKPIGSWPLNPKLFTQPEGIAFDAAANLYISNENGTTENGTILKFSYHK